MFIIIFCFHAQSRHKVLIRFSTVLTGNRKNASVWNVVSRPTHVPDTSLDEISVLSGDIETRRDFHARRQRPKRNASSTRCNIIRTRIMIRCQNGNQRFRMGLGARQPVFRPPLRRASRTRHSCNDIIIIIITVIIIFIAIIIISTQAIVRRRRHRTRFRLVRPPDSVAVATFYERAL